MIQGGACVPLLDAWLQGDAGVLWGDAGFLQLGICVPWGDVWVPMGTYVNDGCRCLCTLWKLLYSKRGAYHLQ